MSKLRVASCGSLCRHKLCINSCKGPLQGRSGLSFSLRSAVWMGQGRPRAVIVRITLSVFVYGKVGVTRLEMMGDNYDAYGQPRQLFSALSCV